MGNSDVCNSLAQSNCYSYLNILWYLRWFNKFFDQNSSRILWSWLHIEDLQSINIMKLFFIFIISI